MKKAIVDQILLGLFIFISLIVFGATISDNMQARDKYYNLKKITDNAVLSLAKYYINVEQSTSDAEDIYYDMLKQSKLGNEIKDSIYYIWDFNLEPNSVIAKIDNYKEETFWFRFLDLASFDLNVSSKANIISNDSDSPKSTYSNGLAPFAVNDQAFSIGDSLDITYELTANWSFSNKETFYPLLTNCDCDCDFILSNNFDFSELGFDVDNCDSNSFSCTSHGESEFTDYSKLIDDIYYSQQSIDFDQGKTSSPICLLGTYLGNTTSTWGTQINHLSSGIYELIGTSGENLPIEMDLITLNSSAIANGIVSVRIDNYDFKTTSNPGNRYIRLNTTIIPSKTKEVELVY